MFCKCIMGCYIGERYAPINDNTLEYNIKYTADIHNLEEKSFILKLNKPLTIYGFDGFDINNKIDCLLIALEKSKNHFMISKIDKLEVLSFEVTTDCIYNFRFEQLSIIFIEEKVDMKEYLPTLRYENVTIRDGLQLLF